MKDKKAPAAFLGVETSTAAREAGCLLFHRYEREFFRDAFLTKDAVEGAGVRSR